MALTMALLAMLIYIGFRFEWRFAIASKNKLTTMLSSPGADFMEVSNKELNIALKESGFRDKYRAENIKNWVANNNMESKEVLAVLSDANKALFETEVMGCQ